jgi:hypothetical protein
MHHDLLTPAQAAELITAGHALLIAGDEAVISTLPRGKWIGGAIPYFMAPTAGVTRRDAVFVHRLPPEVTSVRIDVLDRTTLPSIYGRIPTNGFGVLILPGFSDIHSDFALHGPEYVDFATAPLIGWISGIHLSDLGKITPKVMDGTTGRVLANEGVLLAATLADGYHADLGIINIFTQGHGARITFPEGGWSAKRALVDGAEVDFPAWCKAQKLDVRLPLVADYAGAAINVSIQAIDDNAVKFYAPVFPGVVYRQAEAVSDYVGAFTRQASTVKANNLAFSCNCILNYLYSELEGRRTEGFVGPATFGEIAYQLLNQTLVYLDIQKG